jgi:hypothetical protein
VAHVFDTLQDVIIDHCKTVIEGLIERLLSLDGGGERLHRAVDVLPTAMNMLDTRVYGY